MKIQESLNLPNSTKYIELAFLHSSTYNQKYNSASYFYFGGICIKFEVINNGIFLFWWLVGIAYRCKHIYFT